MGCEVVSADFAMRWLIIAAFLMGTAPFIRGAEVKHYWARVTFYNDREDSFGRNTATGVRAEEGRTVAVDFRVIPKGATVRIKALEGVIGDGVFRAEDTGSAVKSRKAVRSRKYRGAIVVDVFVSSKRMKYFATKLPEYMEVEVIEGV